MSFSKKLELFLNKDIKFGFRILILTLSGALTGLTLAFPKLGFLEWISIIPAAVILLKRGTDKNIRLRSVYFDGLVFFYGFYLLCYYFFLSMYPLEFIDGMTKGSATVVVVVSWLGLSLLQGLMGGCVFLLSAVAFRTNLLQKISWLRIILIAAIWSIFEWSQNFGWWGVPWGKLPLGQTEYIVGIQNASWFGSYFLTFVIVVVNFFFAFALINITKIKIVRVASLTAISLIAFQYLSGTVIWFLNDIHKGETVKIACVQGNISASNKWEADTLATIEKVYTEQTKAAAENGAEIVLWPETAIPYDITVGKYTKFQTDFCALAEETQTYIIVGAYSQTGEGGSYNSLICFTPEGERLDPIYNKRRLVPFGEFVPMRKVFETLIPPLTEILIANEDIVAGDGSNLMDIGGHSVGCLVCFDSIYDGLTLESVRDGAEVICLSTNDSWFEGSAALGIHNSHAQLRAIESGRYVTRSASTGISTIISPRGEVLKHIEPDTEGVIVYDVNFRQNKTLWFYLGNSFIYLCVMICVFLAVHQIVVFIKTKKQKSIDFVTEL